MSYKNILPMLLFATISTTTAWSQKVNISLGYGYPAVDTKYLPAFYGVGRGDISQWGVIAGSVDYQLSRRMSIGVMVTHTSFSAPYYGYFSPTDLPDLTAHMDNWSFMISMTRYFPVSLRTSLYLRTAVGANSWKQDYTDIYGNPATVTNVDLPSLAHQLALGMKFRLTRHAGLFMEGGYGKYIVRAGIAARL